MKDDIIFELKHEMKMDIITGVVILLGIGIMWFLLISNYALIDHATMGFTVPIFFIIGFISIAGLVLVYLNMDKANNCYVAYRRLELYDIS